MLQSKKILHFKEAALRTAFFRRILPPRFQINRQNRRIRHIFERFLKYEPFLPAFIHYKLNYLGVDKN
jgi:hypothetical protein